MSQILDELSVIIPCKDDHLRIDENIEEISRKEIKRFKQ